MFYADYGELLTAVAAWLRGYLLNEEAGHFLTVHSQDELNTVRQLLTDYHQLKANNFESSTFAQNWLHKVADILPTLWD